MLHRVNELHGFAVHSRNGGIGRLTRLYFDDRRWKFRYLHVFSPSGERLVPIEALKRIDHRSQVATLDLTNSEIDSVAPLLIEEHAILGSACEIDPRTHERAVIEGRLENRRVPHLRSTTQIEKYGIHARDAQFGHVEDLVVEEEGWSVPYLVVDTRNWWIGKSVLIPTEWVTRIAWAERSVHVGLTRSLIRQAPAYDHLKPITPSYERALFEHYRPEPLKKTGS